VRSLVVLHPEPSESDSILVELVEDSPIVNIGVLPCLPGTTCYLRTRSSFILTLDIALPL
jgi:hypothetical protein